MFSAIGHGNSLSKVTTGIEVSMDSNSNAPAMFAAVFSLLLVVGTPYPKSLQVSRPICMLPPMLQPSSPLCSSLVKVTTGMCSVLLNMETLYPTSQQVSRPEWIVLPML